jgi:hypothetical protein
MKAAKGLIVAAIAAAAPAFIWAADPAPTGLAPSTAPSTRPIDPGVRALIDKLADDDAPTREAATKQLEKLGREALPALREQANSENPEVKARVRSLIRRAERRLPPAAPPRDGFASHRSTSISVSNGKKTVSVDDNGYRIRIRQDNDGISMDVTGVEDGKEVTETYRAKDADALKRDNPEAFALYDKYNSGGPGVAAFGIDHAGIQGNVQIQINGGGGGGPVIIGPGGRGGMIRPALPPQPIPEEARKRIEEQLEKQDLTPQQREMMRGILEQAERQQQDVQQRVQEQLQEQQRKGIDDLKVPDREDPKPAPKEESKK